MMRRDDMINRRVGDRSRSRMEARDGFGYGSGNVLIKKQLARFKNAVSNELAGDSVGSGIEKDGANEISVSTA